METKLKNIPSGVISLDSLIGGGFPAGSLILLRGQIGAGHKEFVMTSAIMSAAIKKGLIRPVASEDAVLPKEILWVTFTRSPEDLLHEISLSFERDLYHLFRENVKFKDFSAEYFRTSPVPAEWVSKEEVETRKRDKLSALEDAFAGAHRAAALPSIKPKTMLESLVDFLTKNAPKNVVVIYTLSDLARLYSDSESRWYDFTLFIRGLQRAAKKWEGIIYMNMTVGLLEPRKEEEILACVDGVLEFSWEEAGPTKRRRVLYFKKFRGLLPRIDGTAVVKFEVGISPTSGFEVSRAELIEGLK
jgi:KaiC/GvpD/RAD55 family RecA-like ATPase